MKFQSYGIFPPDTGKFDIVEEMWVCKDPDCKELILIEGRLTDKRIAKMQELGWIKVEIQPLWESPIDDVQVAD